MLVLTCRQGDPEIFGLRKRKPMPAEIHTAPKQIPIWPSPEIKLLREIKALLNRWGLRFYACKSIGLQGKESVKSNNTLTKL